MAKGQSWEAQFFKCGVYSRAVAIRFGNDTIIEVMDGCHGCTGPDMEMQIFANGKRVTDVHLELPGGT